MFFFDNCGQSLETFRNFCIILRTKPRQKGNRNRKGWREEGSSAASCRHLGMSIEGATTCRLNGIYSLLIAPSNRTAYPFSNTRPGAKWQPDFQRESDPRASHCMPSDSDNDHPMSRTYAQKSAYAGQTDGHLINTKTPLHTERLT